MDSNVCYIIKSMKEELLEKYKAYLEPFFTGTQIKKLFTRLERISCSIAPLNTDTGNTQTIPRWQLSPENPNYASKEECEKIFNILISDLLGFLGADGYKNRHCLEVFKEGELTRDELIKVLGSSSRIGSLELPLEYKVPLSQGGRHVAENIFWYCPLEALDQLRGWLGNAKIITKIQVKAYLTDRRQTGDYQTNREIRWETNPSSPQFASKKDCLEIELKLLSQISIFHGAPELPVELIPIVERALGAKYVKDSFRCPISGKPIIYEEFFEKVASPVHGRSGFQVGHLNPLATAGGHNSGNISWITDLGNRVQGDSSLEEIAKDIFYMALFHKERLNLTWEEIEDLIKKMKN